MVTDDRVAALRPPGQALAPVGGSLLTGAALNARQGFSSLGPHGPDLCKSLAS